MKAKRILCRVITKSQFITQRLYSEVLPTSEVVIIKKKKSKKVDNLKNEKVTQENKKNHSKEFRVNEVNIQMISQNIYKQLFKNPSERVDPSIIKRCQDNLLKHGIDYNKCSHLPDVELKLPKLEGKDVVEHFYNIGERQCAPYRNLLKTLASCKLPPMPKVGCLIFQLTGQDHAQCRVP